MRCYLFSAEYATFVTDMKTVGLIFLIVTISISCARWKYRGDTYCVKVEAVNSELLNKSSVKTKDFSTQLSIQLSADSEESNFEFVRYKLTKSSDSMYFGTFDNKGFVNFKLEGGIYSMKLKSLDFDEFKLDSVIIIPHFRTNLSIKIGNPEMYMTVQRKK